MSKRCCAQHCFNSTLYTKNVSYFSFPKNKKFADQWADLAGRNDLKEKPLNRIIKYFLCSEHFTANCFNDRETRQILKRDLPHSIALPSIFKNNLQETMQISNPKQSIEVHNIVLLESGEDNRKTKTSSPQNSVACNEIDSDGFSREYSSDLEEPKNGLLKMQVEAIKNLEQRPSPDPEDDQQGNETVVPVVAAHCSDQCRLCLKELKNDEPITQFKDSLHLQEFINRVMSDKITLGDEFSQVVCKNCENNSLLCLIIIQQMDSTQEKIISSRDGLR